MRLSGVSAARMFGCHAVAEHHYLGGFLWGCLAVGELRRVELVGLGEELRWLGHLLELKFVNLVHMLEL